MIGKSWIIAALIGALAGSVAAAWRGQAGGVDERQRDICVDVLPVVEPEGTDLTVVLERPAEGRVPGVTLLYDRKRPPERPDPTATSMDGPARVALTCRFAGTGIDPNATRLVGVETVRRTFNETQIYFLNRFWLTDRAAVAAARAKIGLAEAAAPPGLMQLPGPVGYFLQQIINAGPPSALYGLVAMAYALIYGLTNRINLAFGEMATLGAFAALTGIGLSVVAGGAGVGIALGIAVILAAGVTASIGAMIGGKVFHPLLLRGTQALLVATLGLAVAIQEFLARVQGVQERWLSPILTNRTVIAGGSFDVVITEMQILVVTGAAALAIGVLLFMRRSRFGRGWHAVADDAGMAELIGVDRRRTLVQTFALASALAGLGGAVLTLHYGGTSFHMGTMIGLKALVAAVVGGIGSLSGALVGGVLIGLIETLWSAYRDAEWRDGVVLSLLVIMLVLRPEGLFGGRAALEQTDRRA
jgi:branched-chain amino acid transport system permease protein